MTMRLGEEGFRWFVGTVEDINDPLQLGRARVRILNEHDSPSIVTSDLLWAVPIQPITSAAYQQVGTSPTGLQLGSFVFGFYLDGQEKQLPMIFGSYAKMSDGTQATNDVPALARGQNSIQQNIIGPEPASPYASVYPNNKVTQTSSGHVIEVDDTPHAERLRTYHKSGTYTEIGPDGKLVTKVVGDSYEIIVHNKTLYIQGDINIQVQGNCNFSVNGYFTASSSNFGIDTNGNMITSGSIVAAGDVIGNSISLDHHVHSDNDGGPGTTGGPQ